MERLQGVHRLMPRFLVEVDIPQHGQALSQLQSQHKPFFQRGTQFLLALAARFPKGDYTRAGRDVPCKTAVLQVLVDGLSQGELQVVGDNVVRRHAGSWRLFSLILPSLDNPRPICLTTRSAGVVTMKVPLTPIRCLLWAAEQYGSKVGVVDGERRFTYAQVLDRASRLAAALRQLGADRGDRVATLSFNCHHLLEAYYGVPIARCVLLSLNVRLTPEEQAYTLRHSGTKIVLFDPEFLSVAAALHSELPGLRWVSLEAQRDLPEWVHPQPYERLLEAAAPEPIDYTT